VLIPQAVYDELTLNPEAVQVKNVAAGSTLAHNYLIMQVRSLSMKNKKYQFQQLEIGIKDKSKPYLVDAAEDVSFHEVRRVIEEVVLEEKLEYLQSFYDEENYSIDISAEGSCSCILIHDELHGVSYDYLNEKYADRDELVALGDIIFIKFHRRLCIMNNASRRYDDIGDILEYGNITDEEAVRICNNIIDESIKEIDEQILESMYHAILMGVTYRKIGDKLHTNLILSIINKFDEQVSDYIITILAYTGKKEHIEIIKQIGRKYKNLEIDEAIIELNARIK